MSRARTIDGKAIAAEVRERVRSEVGELVEAGHRPPALATVLVGDDPASEVYVGRKHAACEEAGMRSVHHSLAGDSSQEQVLEVVHALGADPEIDGILVQLPLPEQVEEAAVLAALDPAKDVDGLTPQNAGLLAAGRPGLVPCTPAGVMELLRSEGVELAGAEATILGRSTLVGRPLAMLLLDANATITVCHTRTRDLEAACRRADVLVAAAGRPRLVGPELVKPGATVIDVGISRTSEGLVGDVDFDRVAGVAGAVTPVPGGVGPMTIAMLLRNTLYAARRAV